MLFGLDLGTSSLKAVLLDPETGRMVQEKAPLSILQPAAGCAEADPETWWTALVQVLARLRDKAPADFAAIEAVGISTIFPALVPMDAAGRPLRNSLLYCDLRSVPQVNALATRLGLGEFERRTGNRLTPGTCTLPGICWLRENEPNVFGATHVFGQATTFLIQRLTGACVLDYTQASLSGMTLSGREDAWDDALLELAGIGPERLPSLMHSGAVAGTVTQAAFEACGLRKGVPVVAGAGDAPLAALGGGVVGAHELFCSAGTTDCLLFTGPRAPRNPVFANCRYALPELWVSIGTMTAGGGSIKWCCDRLLHCTPGEMTAWAERAAPGSGGVVFLPYLQGERTPWWDPQARAMLFGLTAGTGREEVCRAVFEGVAFGWRQIVGMLEHEYGFKAAEAICAGGGTTNRFWNTVKASVLGIPVRTLRMPETASLGAALIGGLGAGIFKPPEAARAATEPLRSSDVALPVPGWIETCQENYQTYVNAYPATRDLLPAHGE